MSEGEPLRSETANVSTSAQLSGGVCIAVAFIIWSGAAGAAIQAVSGMAHEHLMKLCSACFYP